MAVKYLDNAGTQYLVNKIKAIDGKIPTESQITTMITTALNTYKEGIVTIVESLPQTGEEGKLYLLVDPSDSDVYIVYTWEDNAFKRMGSKTFTLTVDSSLSATSTNPVQNKVVKSALDGKANSSHTHGSITNDGKLGTASRVVITGTDKKIGISTVTTTQLGYLSGVTSAIQTQLDGKSATGHTHTAGDVAGLATVATSGSYNDLSDKPSINNATLTIQKNGTTVKTFTANASSNVTCNITVPTKTSDITNDSNFVDTSNAAVASGITSAKVTNYDTHIADTDIHVTTADKDRWNNNTYVFRYSSTALVDSSTNSNALLDNTDNLKVGDKVIDSSGVLFSITAIDTQNSTFTIGTALIDLANDSNVVHKSGDETITGFKQFANIRATNSIKAINLDSTTTDLNNCYSVFAPYAESKGGNIQYYYCNTDSGTANISNLPEARAFFLTSITTRLISNSLYVKQILINSNSKTFVRYCNNSIWSSWVNETDSEYVHKSGNETKSGELTLLNTLNSSDIVPSSNNTYDFGSVSNLLRNLYTYHGYFRGQQQGDEYSNNARTNLTLTANRDTLGTSGIVFDSYRQNTAQGTGIHVLGIGIKENGIRYEGCRFGWYWNNDSNGYSFDFKPTTQGANQSLKHNLGTSTDKWDTINGLNPSSLGMPDLSNGIDISSYITDLTGASNINKYTPPVNGWISIGLSSADFIEMYIPSVLMGGTFTKASTSNYSQAFMPVTANKEVRIALKGSSIGWAKFYPCQGNV